MEEWCRIGEDTNISNDSNGRVYTDLNILYDYYPPNDRRRRHPPDQHVRAFYPSMVRGREADNCREL